MWGFGFICANGLVVIVWPFQPGADPIPAFRHFVSSEKDRLMKKKQALMKNEMDKRMAELVKFSKSFKVRLLTKSLTRSLFIYLFADSIGVSSYNTLFELYSSTSPSLMISCPSLRKMKKNNVKSKQNQAKMQNRLTRVLSVLSILFPTLVPTPVTTSIHRLRLLSDSTNKFHLHQLNRLPRFQRL